MRFLVFSVLENKDSLVLYIYRSFMEGREGVNRASKLYKTKVQFPFKNFSKNICISFSMDQQSKLPLIWYRYSTNALNL